MDVTGRGASLQAVKLAVQDLFNLYLGETRNNKNDDTARDRTTYNVRKRIMATSKPKPPKDEQFAGDLMQLQNQFPDQEQLRMVAESTLATLLVNCSGHMVRIEFLLFAVSTLLRFNLLSWDSFIPSLLRAAAAVESSNQPGHALSTSTPVAGGLSGSSALATSIGLPQVSTPAPASPASAIIGSPTYSAIDPAVQSPAKGPDPSSSANPPPSKIPASFRGQKVVTQLRQLVCKVMLIAIEAELRPVTYLDILSQMVQWINTWEAVDSNQVDEDAVIKHRQFDFTEWLYSCLDVIKTLVDEDKCRLPFYALLHDRTQLQIEYWPEDEVLFAFFLEVHRRRDKIALYMQMLDQQLQCPTFSTQRMVAFTYQGVMGEPLYGEDVAQTVQRDTIDWERALRCLKHGLRTNPSSDWWRRVLIFAPRFQQQSNTMRQPYFVSSMPHFVFTAEMTCEAVVDRIMELMQPANTGNTSNDVEGARWQEWLSFADLFYFLVRHGYVDILEFVDKLVLRFADEGNPTIRSNHVTWLLAQVFRLETVTSAMTSDTKKAETTQKILSFHKEERPTDQNASVSPQNMLLDFISSSQILRLWSINRVMAGKHVPEHLQKGKQIDEWWRQAQKGERVLDFSNLDEKSMGMIWVVSFTMSQPVCEAIITWMKSSGIGEVLLQVNMGQTVSDRLLVIQETQPLPMTLLSGLSLHLCTRLISVIEELIFGGQNLQALPSIAMMETYARLLLVAPHALFRCHVNGMMLKYQQTIGKSGVCITILELLNFRLLPLYRYHGKVKQLLYDIAKIIITMKVKRGEHRLFRLAENLCLNLILFLPEVILVKKELKGATTEFSETLNRAMIINLAVTIKTRGIAEFEQLVLLPPAIEQILANSSHSWSEKTLRHFPPLLRELLASRPDKRQQIMQGWQQAEASMLLQCRQLLSPSAEPSHLLNYVHQMLPIQHRQYLCAAAWVLLDKHPESIAIANLGRVLKELSPEEVTANVYAMVDVLLVNAQFCRSAQEGLFRTASTLALLVWSHELLPFDIILLALADRDDDPLALRIVVYLLLESKEFHQRVGRYCLNRGEQEHWLSSGPFQRSDPQQALGGHLIGKDRFPVYFDDICLRMLPVLQLIIFRLIEHDALDTAETLLDVYVGLLAYSPSRFTFVRDTLAYFYGHLPSKFVIKLLTNLDLTKIRFTDAFLRDMPTSNSGHLFVSDYFSNLLVNLVNLVLPPLTLKPSMDMSGGLSSSGAAKSQAGIASATASNLPEVPKVFYQHQDPGSYPQLVLETTVIELLSLPHPPNQIVSTLVNIAVRVQPYAQLHPPLQPHAVSNTSVHANAANPRSPLHPTSPSSGVVDSTANVSIPVAGSSTVGSTHQVAVSSSLMIQACGLLLAQLPTPFHSALYTETARIFKECSWMTDPNRSISEMDAAYGYSAWDPMWAAEDDTSTIIGNSVALLHAFAANLSFEWLEGMHAVITHQRPITSVAQLRVAFRVIGPLLPRLVISKPLFAKTLALLFTILADVFGQKAQVMSSVSTQEISDLIDFLHHAVALEAQTSGKPRPETLLLCSKAVERLRADLQPHFRHLSMDTNTSIYAATHPKLVQRPPSPLIM